MARLHIHDSDTTRWYSDVLIIISIVYFVFSSISVSLVVGLVIRGMTIQFISLQHYDRRNFCYRDCRMNLLFISLPFSIVVTKNSESLRKEVLYIYTSSYNINVHFVNIHMSLRLLRTLLHYSSYYQDKKKFYKK